MLFNSIEFIIFFIFIALFLLLLRKNKDISILVIIFFSLLFYGYEKAQWIILILFSISINYLCSYLIKKNVKYIFNFGIIFNLGILFFYKYLGFFFTNLNFLFEQNFSYLNIALPIGISFYSFQQISYLFDCREKKNSLPRFSEYLLYVSFFPQLIAGPIVKSKDFFIQVTKNYFLKPTKIMVLKGITIFIIGLFKKTFIADNIAIFSDAVFNNANSGTIGFLDSWIGVFAFSLQIYFDFSSYSDMAIGLGLILGVKLPINFSSPYKSENIIEFWRSWHITLSNFLREYLYIKIGGNRNGRIRNFINFFIVMILGGIWHGASWTFVLWGVVHAIYISTNHFIIDLFHKYQVKIKIPQFIKILFTFCIVSIAWVFFRSENLEIAVKMFEAMFILKNYQILNILDYDTAIVAFKWISILLIICWFLPNTNFLINYNSINQKNEKPFLNKYVTLDKLLLVLSFLLLISVLTFQVKSPFLYFKF